MTTKTFTMQYACAALEELSLEDSALVEAAKKACATAYAPYSNFHVGAAVALENGVVVCGSNQENAAYPSGLCAERTTLFYANAAQPNQAIEALAVASYTNGKFTNIPVPPCGACRQVMLEVEQRYHQPIRILLYGTEGIYVVEGGIRELLPLTFDVSFLK
jgi:cytidine deaminase